MERKIVITADGSTTIHLPEWNEHYHSKHGAIQEAYHVFIKNGLSYFCHPELLPADRQGVSGSHSKTNILEVGFGTGLNTFITLLEAEKNNMDIDYTGVEAYPVSIEEIEQLNYPSQLNEEEKTALFNKLHNLSWEEKHVVTAHFHLTKQKRFFSEIADQNKYDIIYFDAFGARVQPELWTEDIFEKMHQALKINGILVTYAAKGSVRRAMLSVGFKVEKLPGPPGKREMLRATRL